MRVLIVGGGVAALEAMLALRRLAEERVEIVLISPEKSFAYQPLSVAEPFGLGAERRFNLAEILADASASSSRTVSRRWTWTRTRYAPPPVSPSTTTPCWSPAGLAAELRFPRRSPSGAPVGPTR